MAVLALRAGSPGRVTLTIQAEGKPIGPSLSGVFFEDIKDAAVGGLYGELVQSRCFEYQPTGQPTWSAMTASEPVTRDGGGGWLAIADAVPVHQTGRITWWSKPCC